MGVSPSSYDLAQDELTNVTPEKLILSEDEG